MKLLARISALLTVALLAGCVTPRESWTDTTRKSVHTSVLVIDKFLAWEHTHEVSPGLKVIADDLRTQVPGIVRDLRSSLNLFDATANADVKAQAEGYLATLQSLADAAAAALARAQAQAAPTTSSARPPGITLWADLSNHAPPAGMVMGSCATGHASTGSWPLLVATGPESTHGRHLSLITT